MLELIDVEKYFPELIFELISDESHWKFVRIYPDTTGNHIACICHFEISLN